MGIYKYNGTTLGSTFNANGVMLFQAYDVFGNELLYDWITHAADSGYSFTDGINSCSTKLMFNFGTTSFQSVVLDRSKYLFYRASTDDKVYPYNNTLTAQSTITLPSTGGHKNDGCYYNGHVYWLDGTAADNTALYVWDVSANTLQSVSIPVSDNPNGSKRVVAGICNTDTSGFMYLVSRDQYNGSDIDHQTGDVMCVYRYDVTNNTVELINSYDWDCVYVQGATYVGGKLYVACNTQTTGSASNYTGITIKIIDTTTWEIAKTLTCSGSYEPQGCDHITYGDNSYIWTGLSKYNTVDKVVLLQVNTL